MVNPPAGGGQPPQPTTNVPIKPAQTTRMGSAVPPQQPTIPYSARKAAALDLRTVERKGDPAVRSPPPRHRPHALPEAPVFRPTEAEFRDPMQYIRSISARANKFGICKIIPPDNWSPDFAIDLEVRLKTKRVVSHLHRSLTILEIPFSNSKTRAQLCRWRYVDKIRTASASEY